MKDNLSSFTKDAFEARLDFLLKSLSLGFKTVESPSAILLGGQSGAGKTRLHKICSRRLNGNAIVINGDEFRKSHPQFAAIQERYGIDSPKYTAQWSGQMTEALIDGFSSQGYNLIIGGTLRTSDVPLRTARALREKSYSTSLAIMAVKPQISLISCQIRYEMMRLAGTTPRATDPEHHNKIVHDIVDNLEVLCDSGLFDDVLIYDRAERLLFPAEESATDENAEGEGRADDAATVLKSTLFGPWTAEEELHFKHLQEQLELLESL